MKPNPAKKNRTRQATVAVLALALGRISPELVLGPSRNRAGSNGGCNCRRYTAGGLLLSLTR